MSTFNVLLQYWHTLPSIAQASIVITTMMLIVMLVSLAWKTDTYGNQKAVLAAITKQALDDVAFQVSQHKYEEAQGMLMTVSKYDNVVHNKQYKALQKRVQSYLHQ